MIRPRIPSCALMLVVACIFVALAMVPAAARAQAHSDSTAADVLFEEGRGALARGDVATACAKFEASRMLEPAVGTLLNLGDCRQRLGRRREAWVAYREALRFMTPTDERRGLATARIAALEAQLGRLLLRMENGTPDATVVLDGETIAAPYDAVRLVEPGRHEVRVRADGRLDALFVTTVEEAKTAALVIAPGARATSSGDRAEGRVERPGRRTMGLALGGSGVAILAGGAAFGVAALVSASDARARCGGGLTCDDAAALDTSRDDARTAGTRATVSTILLSTGAVVTAIGLYLWLTSTGPAAAFSRAPGASSGAAGALEF